MVKRKHYESVNKNDVPEPQIQQAVPVVMRQYLEALKAQIKISTYGIYSTHLENRIVPYFAETKCADLNQLIIQNFADMQLASGLSPKTTRSVLIFLKKGLESVSPINYDIKLPRYSVKGLEILTASEQRRLEAAAKYSDAIDHLGIAISLYTGIKPGELCGLMWQDIDFDRRLLSIRRTAQRIKNTDENSETKTNFVFLPANRTARRVIPLADFLLRLLAEHKAQASGEYVISKDGAPIQVRSMQYRFAKLLQTAGIRPLPLQAARDTFAARALKKGFDLKSLGEILGHSTILITVKKYGKLLELDEYRHIDMEAIAKEAWG